MTEEEITWKMPSVGIGQCVKVFPFGRDDGSSHMAFVTRVNDRSIDVKSPLGTARGGVRFLGDPVLKNTSEENLREWGAWDFTDESKLVQENISMTSRVDAMEKRLKTLEELFDKKTK